MVGSNTPAPVTRTSSTATVVGATTSADRCAVPKGWRRRQSASALPALAVVLLGGPTRGHAQPAGDPPRFPSHAPTPTPRAPDPGAAARDRSQTDDPPSAEAVARPFDGIAIAPAQAAALRERTLATRAALRAVRARRPDGAPLTAADRDEMRGVIEAHNAAVRALLTEPQRARFDANVSDARAARRAQIEQRFRDRRYRRGRPGTAGPTVPNPGAGGTPTPGGGSRP